VISKRLVIGSLWPAHRLFVMVEFFGGIFQVSTRVRDINVLVFMFGIFSTKKHPEFMFSRPGDRLVSDCLASYSY